MLDIVLSGLLYTKHVNDVSPELESSMDGDGSLISFSDAHGDSGSPNDVSVIGLGTSHPEQSSQNMRGVSRINPLFKAFELRLFTICRSRHRFSHRARYNKRQTGDNIIPASVRSKVSSKRRLRPQTETSKRKASVSLQ